MKRIVTLLCILSFFTLTNCQDVRKENGSRPNIIFILSDDQRDNTFGIMGSQVVKSPAIDKLIKNGVRFSNTYIAEPTCSPSRVALLTGIHERVNGIGFTSSYQLTEQQWENTYPALLRKHGYYTGFIGKFGVEYYDFKDHVTEKFDYWWAHNGWTKFFPKDFDSKSTNPYHRAKNDIITPIMGEAIEEFLNTKSSEKPFCLSLSLNVPHGSQTTSMYTEKPEAIEMMIPANENPKLKDHPIYDDLYRDNEIEIPQETATDPYRFIPKKVLDQSKGRATRTYKYNYNRKSCYEHHIRYYQQITGIDKIVGDLMANLEKKELAENTIIIYASDHGLLMGEYGMGGKALLYDLTSKIPCFIFDPRMEKSKRGTTITKLVSSLDLTTTILDYAGVSAPKEMEGMSLIPLINDEKSTWRNELFLENLYTGRDNPFCEGIRYNDWKYIRMFDGIPKYSEADLHFGNKKPDFEQLFNLKDDPKEIVNMIEKYEGTDLLNELRKKTINYSNELNKDRQQYKNSYVTKIR